MSSREFDASLKWLATGDNRRLIDRGLRGLEKECLRVGRDGELSATPHSRRFGSALTHPWITTDYSEALLEFVTPPESSSEDTLDFLADLHAFVVREGEDELLWPASMPCIVTSDEAVPIAQYGSSNEGRLRTIYRSGLGVRYGRAMQAIAGTHFNYSLPPAFWPAFREHEGSALDARAFQTECLMRLVRNYRRCGWLLTYLYGASPAFSKSFRPQGHPRLESLNADTWYAPFSTSLRVSDMGYRNSTQARLNVGVNSLEEYLDGLAAALTSVDPRYAAIGVQVGGEYRQLNANVLQLENEYYSSIRPKPASKSPRLIAALRAHGVEYVEVRTLDLNPFVPVGVSLEQMRFVEALLLYCLMSGSPPIQSAEQAEIDQRELAVAWEGRKPGLRVPRQGASVSLRDFALEILDALAAVAPLLDGRQGEYGHAVAAARGSVQDPAATLSARVLDGLAGGRRSFFDWAFEIAARQREHFLQHEFAPGRLAELEAVAAESLKAAAAREAGPEPPFAEYLAGLLASGVGRGPAARRNL
jgi:glutamate--cysteine ligase